MSLYLLQQQQQQQATAVLHGQWQPGLAGLAPHPLGKK